MKKSLALILFLTSLLIQNNLFSQFMVNGYVPNYRSTNDIINVDYNNLDIAFFAFVFANSDGSLVPVDSWNIGKSDTLVKYAHLAGKKAYLSLGGQYGSTELFNMANNPASRANFVSNIIAYLQANNFDGLDIDWEGLFSAAERTAHENLMADLRTAIDAQGTLGLILTIGSGDYFGQYFSNAAVGYADYLQIMAYDKTATWPTSPFGNHSSYAVATEGVDYWSGRGIAKSKMILGLPCYGYQFASTAGGSGIARSYSSIISVEPDLRSNDDATANGLTLFNNQDLIMQKVEYAMTQGLAGVFFWEMTQDTDDKRSLHKAAMYKVNSVTPPPLANFLVSKKTPNVLEAITFSNHSSLGPASSYEWDFGADANPPTASGIGPHTVSYSSLGYKTAELTVTGSGGNDTKTKTNFINVSVTSSILDPSSMGISIYPNPSNSIFYIDSKNIKIESVEIYNSMSQKVKDIEASTFNKMTIDFSEEQFQEGMYILILRTQGGDFVEKIFKMN